MNPPVRFFALFWLAVIGFSGVASAAGPSVGSWETFGNGPSHSGYYPANIGPNNIVASWSVEFTVPINQVVVADGRVFYTTNGYFTDGMHAGALEASSGKVLWQYPLASAYSVNPPTYADGKVYFLRGNNYDDTHLWCLDAVTGRLLWAAPPRVAQREQRYMAPIVIDGGVCVSGGYGGMFGFYTTNGSQRFFAQLPQVDGWTPSYAGGVLYSWVGGMFRAMSPTNGAMLWGGPLPGDSTKSTKDHTVAVMNGRAFVTSTAGLWAIDLTNRKPTWSVSGTTFTGTPAVDQTTVYALAGTQVRAYNAATGQYIGAYEGSGFLIGQPIVTLDRVIAASSTTTCVFDRATRQLLKTLPTGGSLSYANGRLYVTSQFDLHRPGRISTYTIKLAQPEPTPLPTPPPTPPPTPAPTPTLTPTPPPTPTPAPSSQPTPTPTPPTDYAGPLWIDAQAAEGIAYFLFGSPSRIERFDLNRRLWLDAFPIPAKPVAFTVDDGGIYVSYGLSIWRMNLDGSGFSWLLNTAYSTTALLTDGNILYLGASTVLSSVNKITGQPLAVKKYSNAMQGLSIAREGNIIFSRSSGISPANILRVEVSTQGGLGAQTGSPYPGGNSTAPRTYVSPDEQRVVDGTGIIYNASDLSYAGSLAGGMQDLAFYGNLPVALREQNLIAYSDAFAETGRGSLPGKPQRVFVLNSDAFIFYSAGTRGVWALRVPLEPLSAVQPGQAVDPNGLAYIPDKIELGDGIVYLLSRGNRSVFRWSISKQKYLSTISLTDVPSQISYSAANHRLYLGYPSGRIGYFANGAPGTETGFIHLPDRVDGLTAAGTFVFAGDPSEAWNTHYTFGANTSLLSSKDWNYYSTEYIWNAANRKMYFLSDDTSPNDVLWEDIGVDGKLGQEMDSPYHDGAGVSHPVRVSPDGSTVLLGSGRMFDGLSLTQTRDLSTAITDALWVDGTLCTLENGSGGSLLRAWSASTNSTTKELSLEGTPLRMFDTGRDLLVITLEEGRPQFTLAAFIRRPSPTPPVSTPTPAPDTTDRVPPRVKVEGPTTRTAQFGFIILSGSATDNRAVQRVEIRKLGGVYKRTSGKPRFWYQLLDLDPGRNTFFVRATDSSGNVSKEVRVIVIRD
jgi:hypothetical protein